MLTFTPSTLPAEILKGLMNGITRCNDLQERLQFEDSNEDSDEGMNNEGIIIDIIHHNMIHILVNSTQSLCLLSQLWRSRRKLKMMMNKLVQKKP